MRYIIKSHNYTLINNKSNLLGGLNNEKTILTSTLAIGLGITGFAADNSADAAEQNIDKNELISLAQKIQNN